MSYVVMRLKDSYSLDSYNEIRPYLKLVITIMKHLKSLTIQLL
jgi:hypothetical protein